MNIETLVHTLKLKTKNPEIALVKKNMEEKSNGKRLQSIVIKALKIGAFREDGIISLPTTLRHNESVIFVS